MKTGILLAAIAIIAVGSGCMSDPESSTEAAGEAGNSGAAGATTAGSGGGNVSPGSENTDSACSDGIDNDKDGHLDCNDYDCSKNSQVTVCGGGSGESSASACADGVDNDGDNYVDCNDKDCCAVLSSCPTSSYCGKQTKPGQENSSASCSNNADDDADDTADCDDVGCCGVRDCPDGTGCNPGGICMNGIAEVTSQYPTGSPTMVAVPTGTDSDVGPFPLHVSGVDIEWKPQHSVPYTTECLAVDQFIKSPECHVTVQRQEWKSDSNCGTLQGTINLVYTDGSGLSVSIVFASPVALTEQQVTFGP